MSNHDADDELDEQVDDSVSRLAWFLTGAVIGATVAILYAPKSGRDTRKYIADRAEQGRQAVASTSQDIVDASREMFERGRKLVDEASDLFDRARRMVKG
ncbi:MAG TPA: YtxH domain-containing protein [Verrucomicrobiae bacterium]|nr:YtxH domain-containing protein [Verrucomicrobiae bacterium]